MSQIQENIGAISLLDVLRGMLRRRKKLVLASTLIFAALGWLFVSMATPQYTAEAQILVEYEDTPYTRTNGQPLGPAVPQIGEREVNSQVAVLKSRDMALKVLRKLNLIGTPEFDPLKKGIGLGGRLKIMLGFAADPRKQTPEQRALDVWFERLKAYALPGTKVIVVSFSSESPKTAAAVANALVEAYVEQTHRSQLEKTGEAREWLKEQIEKLRRKVVEAEVAVERFRAKAGLFQGTQAKLHNQQLSELSAQIVQAAAERSRLQARAKTIRELLKKGEVDKSAEVLQSPLIQRLREQQVQLKRRLAELSTVYLDNHPRVKAVKRELADLQRQIHVEARKIAEALEQQARIAAGREAELRKQLEELKARVSTAQLDEVKLRELEREAKANRALLESFLARYSDALTRKDAQALPRMARVISRADAPAMPSFPKTGPVMILATLAGFVLGLGLAFVLEVMAAIREVEQGAVVAQGASAAAGPAQPEREPEIVQAGNAADGAEETGACEPSSGALKAPKVENIVAALRPRAVEALENAKEADVKPASGQEDFAQAMAARLHEVAGEQGNVLAIASLLEDAQDSAQAMRQVAQALAAHGRTLLIDADMEEAALSAEDAGAGLSDILTGKAKLGEALRALDGQLHFMPAGQVAQEVQALAGNKALHQLLMALKPHYAHVLLAEGMPKFPAEKLLSVLPMADVVALLLPAEEGARQIAQALRDALRKQGGRAVIMQEVPQDAACASLPGEETKAVAG